MSQPIDALLVTGDLADLGADAGYREAAKIFTGPFPVLFGPGNRDVRGPFRENLLGLNPDGGPINELHRIGDGAVPMCDSTIPGQHRRSIGRRDARVDPHHAGRPLIVAPAVTWRCVVMVGHGASQQTLDDPD